MIKNHFQGLRRLRFEHNMSQKSLAEATGLERTTLHKLEQGISVPSLTSAVKLAAVFGLTLDEFIEKIAPPGTQPNKPASKIEQRAAVEVSYRLTAYSLHSKGKSYTPHFVDREIDPEITLCYRPLPEGAIEVDRDTAFEQLTCLKCRNALRARGYEFEELSTVEANNGPVLTANYIMPPLEDLREVG